MIVKRKSGWVRAAACAAVVLGVGISAGIPATHAAPTGSATGPAYHGPWVPKFLVYHHPGQATVQTATTGNWITVPYFQGSFAYGGKTYPYQMVGTDPSGPAATTAVPNEIIPVEVVFSNNYTFNGAKNLANVLASPMYNSTKFSTGTTSFPDAFQRAEWWNLVHAKDWHTRLATPNIRPTWVLNVPAADGEVLVIPSDNNRLIGLIDINWFDSQLQNYIYANGIKTTTLPIFMTYNTFLGSLNPLSCCVLGYHNAAFLGGPGPQTYAYVNWNDPDVGTYGFGDSDLSDIMAMSHEIQEWMNDPFTDNITPNWSVPTAPQYGCSNSLEVGDPLVGYSSSVYLNGYIYHPQDMAMKQWFMKQSPSTAINGAYTYPDESLFTTPAPTC